MGERGRVVHWAVGVVVFAVNFMPLGSAQDAAAAITNGPRISGNTLEPDHVAAESSISAVPSGAWSEVGIGMTAAPTGRGYSVVASTGAVFTLGAAGFYGSMGETPLNAPIVGMTATPGGRGYWLAAADGGIFTFGDAGYFGSTGAMVLDQPIVGMTATPDGKGYWLVAADGGMFSFGDAHFFGSMGGRSLNSRIVGMSATSDGEGYWLVAADGGIFSFADAHFLGSMGGRPLNAQIVGMTAVTGGGYWMVAADGGIFTFGKVGFFGSTGALTLAQPIVGITATSDGHGYWMVAADGGIFNFGDAGFFGSASADITPMVVNQLASTGGARQVIVVDAPSFSSTTATLSTFQNNGSGWYQVFDPMPAVDGTHGWILGPNRQEGDGTSPAGIYQFGTTMYGTQGNPGVRFPYQQLICGDWWDEDAADPGYNTYQAVPCDVTPPFAPESEALWTEGNAYPSMAVINYNTPPAGPLGSGIFLHENIGKPTQGCISLPYSDLVSVLDWMNPTLHPVIVMGPDSILRNY